MGAQRTVAALVSALVAWAPPARAQVRDLRWDPAGDAALTIGSSALFLAGLVLEPRLAPTACRWCAENAFDGTARSTLRWGDPSVAADFSNVTGFMFAPASAFGLDSLAASHDRGRGLGVDALAITEATMIALDVNELTKLLFARERPAVHAARRDANARWLPTSDDFLSLYSGHAASTLALAASSGTVATMRGYRWAPVPWAVGGALAASTGYLRIAADRHWLTDVLVGMVTGLAIGVLVPLALHAPTRE